MSVSSFELKMPPGGVKPGGHILAIVGGALLSAVLVSFASASDLHGQIVFGSVAFTAWMLTLLVFVGFKRQQVGLASPGLASWMLVYAAGAYGLSTITILTPQVGSQRIIQASWIPAALILSAAAFTTFAIGYRHGPSLIASRAMSWIFTRSLTPTRLEMRGTVAMTVVYFVGIGVTVLTAQVTGSFGYLGTAGGVDPGTSASPFAQGLALLAGLRTVAILGLSHLWCERRRSADFVALLTLSGGELLLGLLAAQKQPFIVLALAIALPQMRRLPRLPVLRMVATIAIFVVFVTPFVGALRDSLVGGTRANVGESVTIGLRLLRSGSYLESTSTTQSTGAFSTRVRQIDNLALIQATTPGMYPYRSTTEILLAPLLGVVPRAVWPSKPVRLTGYEFYRTYYRGQGVSASATTVQGSLYLYGGAGVVLIGMAVIGTFVRALDETVAVLGAIEGSLLLLIFFPIMIKQEIDVASLLAGLPVLVLSYYLGRAALKRPVAFDSEA